MAISHSTLNLNQALAGAGGAEQNGSVAAGGGLFLFDFLGGVNASIADSTFLHNTASGGDGDGAGGDGLGGIAVGSLGAAFGAPGQVEITTSLIAHNVARGGRSSTGVAGDGQGGGLANLELGNTAIAGSVIASNQAVGGRGVDGGNGQGGGLYNVADATTTLTHSFVIGNRARGGQGTSVGTDGLGQGGGIFNAAAGIFKIDAFSRLWTHLNNASEDGDDIFGTLITL